MNSTLVELVRLAVERGATDQEISVVTGYARSYICALRSKNGIKNNKASRTSDRLTEIVERLRSGATLQEIGDSLGVTRERIRQLAVRAGVAGKTGMRVRQQVATKIRADRREAFSKERDGRYQEIYGCSFEEVVRLNEGLPLAHPKSKTVAFSMWKRNARTRMRAPISLTFLQWCELWKPYWEERGRGNGYRLGRIDRAKGFTADNVVIERGDEGMARQRKVSPWNTTKNFCHASGAN